MDKFTALASRWRIIQVLAITCLLTACSSSPPKPNVDYKQDYDFTQVKKIGLYRDSGQVSGDNPLQLSDIQRERIDTALAYALDNRGFRMVDNPAEADLLLSWHLVTQHKTDVRTWETPSYGVNYSRYGRYNRYSMYNCWNCAPTRTEVSVQNYTQGTFIVDMIDPKLQKSVWRGVTQSRLKGQQSEDQGKYNEAATRIFASFPP
jgi:hypothetical protein